MDYSHLRARTDIIGNVVEVFKSSKYKDLKMYGENMVKTDMDSHEMVMEYMLKFENNENATVNPDPIIRTRGYISFVVGTKVGTGTRKLLELVDFIHQNFKHTWIEKNRLETPRDVGAFTIKDWYFHRIDVPFRFDSQTYNNP